MNSAPKIMTKIAIVFLFAAAVGLATPLITFTTPVCQNVTGPGTLCPTATAGGGQISFGNAPGFRNLVGSNIIISTISSGSTTANCVSCALNFTTGNIQSISNVGVNRTWVFSGGPQTLGQFTVTGTVPTAGITTSTVLLTGYFTAPTVQVLGVVSPVLPRSRFFSGSLFDMKDPGLVNYLLGPTFVSTNGNFFTGNYVQDFFDNNTGGAQAKIKSDVLYTGIITNDNATPEPGAAILFSSMVGAIFLAGSWHRRRRKAAAINVG